MSDIKNTNDTEVKGDDLELEADEDNSTESQTPETVPYNRLKKEVDKRKTLEDQIKELKTLVESRDHKENLREFKSELDTFNSSNKTLVDQLIKDGDVDSVEELNDVLTKLAHSDTGKDKPLDDLFKDRYKRLFKEAKKAESEETNAKNPTGDEKVVNFKNIEHKDFMSLDQEGTQKYIQNLMG